MQKLDWFSFKIASFNSVGFLFTAGGTTFVDARLTSHVVFGARHYPLGLHICWLALVVFLVSYVFTVRSTSRKFKIFFPAITLSVAGFLSLFNFRPEFPHAGLVLWLFGYFCVGLASSWIHYFSIRSTWLTKKNIDLRAKIERIKEHITLWRTVAVSLTFGYLALLIPWSNMIWGISQRILTKTDEVFLLSTFNVGEMLLVSLYVLVGLIWEAFRKAHLTADLLLDIR